MNSADFSMSIKTPDDLIPAKCVDPKYTDRVLNTVVERNNNNYNGDPSVHCYTRLSPDECGRLGLPYETNL